jgi:hypothetical protein
VHTLRAMEEFAGVTFPALDSPVSIIVIDGDSGAFHAHHATVTRYDTQLPAFWYRIEDCWYPGSDNDGFIELRREGTAWARGWDEETKGALLAAYALLDGNSMEALSS